MMFWRMNRIWCPIRNNLLIRRRGVWYKTFSKLQPSRLYNTENQQASYHYPDTIEPTINKEKHSESKVPKYAQPTLPFFHSLKNPLLIGTILIQQGESVLKNKLLNNQTRSVILECVHFLKTIFPNYETVILKPNYSKTIAPFLSEDNPKDELREYVKNTMRQTNSISVFIDACIAIGDMKVASNFLENKRKESRTAQGILKGIILKDIMPYELLIDGYAKQGNITSIEKVIEWLKVDGLEPSLKIYLSCLECLGRGTSEDNVVADYVSIITNKGYDLSHILGKDVYSGDSLKYILKSVLRVQPNFRPLMLPHRDESRQPVLQHLMSQLSGGFNPVSNVCTTEELKKGFKEQFDIECNNGIMVQPVTEIPKLENTEELNKKRNLLIEERGLWSSKLTFALQNEIDKLEIKHREGKFTAYPFLKMLSLKDYANIMISEIDNMVTQSAFQYVNSFIVYSKLGERVEAACNLKRRKQSGSLDQMVKVYHDYLSSINQKDLQDKTFRELWNTAQLKNLPGPTLVDHWPRWSHSTKALIGKVLYDLIYEHLRFNLKTFSSKPSPRQEIPALFEIISEYPQDFRKEIKIHPVLFKWYKMTGFLPLRFTPTELPMLCPPLPWSRLDHAGYLISQSFATRLIRKSTDGPDEDLNFDPSQILPVFDALNILGSSPWKVNQTMLDHLTHVFKNGGDVKLNIPKSEVDMPPIPKLTKDMSLKKRKETYKIIRDLTKQKAEMKSLWATELYRLSIATKFRNKTFWLPHSMDFRGRVYPCAPHFNHMGNDVSRCILKFATGRKLGEHGLNWLKIHLVNLTGLKKRASQTERLQFADSNIDNILDSADNPFSGRGWWMNDEDAWQTLACCIELAAAIRCKSGPENYVSSFPVHQDGSCNGLQHYAALGRDQKGAYSVNLIDMEVPQDVYGDVVELVEAQRAEDEEKGLEVAKVLHGFVKRKVIKQSVMTTVYGVTLYGATEQIGRQLADIDNFPKEWIPKASNYLAQLTLGSIGKIFTSSAEIQSWFAKMAHGIATLRNSHVTFVTPLQLPVIQPYSYTSPKKSPGVPNVSIDSQSNWHLLYWPNPIKQKNAFPPNFIHSLDSVHMMLTALHCFRVGISFASVHDCFWTHAATVDIMNRVCREEFVALHSQPILENLSDYLYTKFAYTDSEINEITNSQVKYRALQFNLLLKNVPKRGHLNLNDVLQSTYFFS